MTVTAANARKSATIAAAKALPFAKGKGAAERTVAFEDVVTGAYIEGKSRADVVTMLRGALGKAPTEPQVAACRSEYIIGRVAAALKEGADAGAHIAAARDVVLHYAAPVKDGVKARALRKGQKGRRSIAQHKAVRAAEEAWSQLKAEVLPQASAATTQKERNAKKAGRAPAMAGTTARGKAGQGITHSELVKGDGPMTAEAARDYLNGMAATLLAFCNKHAGVVPTDYGTAVQAFKSAADKASVAFAARADK